MALSTFEVMYHLPSAPKSRLVLRVLTDTAESAKLWVKNNRCKGETIVIRYVIPDRKEYIERTRTCGYCRQTRIERELTGHQIHPGELDRDSHLWETI